MEHKQLIELREPTTRQELIIELLTKGVIHREIAKQLGISRSTVEREINTWLNSDAFNTWLKSEWCRIYAIKCDSNSDVAFKALTQLIKRGGIEINVVNKAELTNITVVFGSDKQAVKTVDVE